MKIEIVRVPDTLWGEMPENVTVVSPYANFNLPTRVCRRFFSERRFIQGIINNPKLKHSDADVLIVFDSISIEFLRWLKKHNPDKRIVLWYWNPAYLTIDPNKVPEGIEKWSYSQSDCEKYGMRFNTQFCFPERYSASEDPAEPIYDVLFVGTDKGRREAIESCRRMLDECGFRSFFRIVTQRSDYIPYGRLIELTQQSRCILDYCVQDDVGMSLRALEALLLSKKVITNNKMYVHEKYYHPQNVFILGIDDISRLKDFIESPLAEIDADTKRYYSFSEWINRF